MAFCKESMINRLSNLINRNHPAAKISQVLCSSVYTSGWAQELSFILKLKVLSILCNFFNFFSEAKYKLFWVQRGTAALDGFTIR